MGFGTTAQVRVVEGLESRAQGDEDGRRRLSAGSVVSSAPTYRHTSRRPFLAVILRTKVLEPVGFVIDAHGRARVWLSP